MVIDFKNLPISEFQSLVNTLHVKQKVYLEFTNNSISGKVFPPDKTYIKYDRIELENKIFENEDLPHLIFPLFSLDSLLPVLSIYEKSDIKIIDGTFTLMSGIQENNIISKINFINKKLSYEVKSLDYVLTKAVPYLSDEKLFNFFSGNDIISFDFDLSLFNRIKFLINDIDTAVLTKSLILELKDGIIFLRNNNGNNWKIEVGENLANCNENFIFVLNDSILKMGKKDYKASVSKNGNTFVFRMRSSDKNSSLVTAINTK